MNVTMRSGSIAKVLAECKLMLLESLLLGHKMSWLHERAAATCLQGFVVMAMEHADGTASAVRLSNGKFRSYGGWPPTEEGRLDQTRSACKPC